MIKILWWCGVDKFCRSAIIPLSRSKRQPFERNAEVRSDAVCAAPTMHPRRARFCPSGADCTTKSCTWAPATRARTTTRAAGRATASRHRQRAVVGDLIEHASCTLRKGGDAVGQATGGHTAGLPSTQRSCQLEEWRQCHERKLRALRSIWQ